MRQPFTLKHIQPTSVICRNLADVPLLFLHFCIVVTEPSVSLATSWCIGKLITLTVWEGRLSSERNEENKVAQRCRAVGLLPIQWLPDDGSTGKWHRPGQFRNAR